MITPTSATNILSHPEPKPQPTSKRRARVMRTQEQWKALLEEFNASGLTRTAFCKKHKISTSSLYRWQLFFASSPGDTDFIDVTQTLSDTSLPPAIQTSENKWQVELELGAGMVLRLRTS